jgi:hypothetical protein
MHKFVFFLLFLGDSFSQFRFAEEKEWDGETSCPKQVRRVCLAFPCCGDGVLRWEKVLLTQAALIVSCLRWSERFQGTGVTEVLEVGVPFIPGQVCEFS